MTSQTTRLEKGDIIMHSHKPACVHIQNAHPLANTDVLPTHREWQLWRGNDKTAMTTNKQKENKHKIVWCTNLLIRTWETNELSIVARGVMIAIPRDNNCDIINEILIYINNTYLTIPHKEIQCRC